MSAAPLLHVDGLDVSYRVPPLRLHAVRDVHLTVAPGEIVGLIGESGCGKSTLGSAVPGLLPGNAEVHAGRVLLEGDDLLALDQEALRRRRGRRVALIPQDPLQSLNPTLTIGRQMADAVLAHAGRGRRRRALAGELATLLERVGLPDGRDGLRRYPHELSGGMRQRVLVAMALSLEPALIVADEPTSALDVTLQAQIVELLRGLRDTVGTAVLLVTHDIGVVAQLCDRVAVMYAGRIVESAAVQPLFADPRHPYAQALLAAVPGPARRGRRLATIPGRVPHLGRLPGGCAFADRCPLAAPVCRASDPAPVTDHASLVRCHARDPHSGWEPPAPGAVLVEEAG